MFFQFVKEPTGHSGRGGKPGRHDVERLRSRSAARPAGGEYQQLRGQGQAHSRDVTAKFAIVHMAHE